MPAAAKKSTGRRAPAKTGNAKTGKPAAGAKKPVAKKPVRATSTPKKAPTKKAPAKKVVTKKAVAKAPVKKAPAKAAPVKKAPVKKAAAKALAAPAKVSAAKRKTVICELSGFEVTPSPANLSPKTLDRLRQKLLEEKQRLLHQADDLAAEAEQLARDREAGDTQFDEESGEGDTVNVERERDLLLSSQARQVVEAIDTALVRIKKGAFGVCRYAGRRISLERLEVIPWADVCVDCKARAERRR